MKSYYFKESSLFSVKSFRNQCKTWKPTQEKLVGICISSQRCDLFDYFSDESVFSLMKQNRTRL